MADKWLPPLLCPIPKGHANHAHTHNVNTLTALLKRRNRHRSTIYEDEQRNQWADLSHMKSNFYRLFARRKKKHAQRYIPPDRRYFLYTPTGKYICSFKTKKQALMALNKDVITITNSKQRKKVGMIPGTFVIINRFDPWFMSGRFLDYRNHEDKLPIASKKCAECPNKTSNRGICHCQFWSSIRDGSQKVYWYTPHESKMEMYRRRKNKKVIKVSFNDLFE